MPVNWKPTSEGQPTTWTAVHQALGTIIRYQQGRLYRYDEECAVGTRSYIFVADSHIHAELRIQWILNEACSSVPYNPLWLTDYKKDGYVALWVE